MSKSNSSNFFLLKSGASEASGLLYCQSNIEVYAWNQSAMMFDLANDSAFGYVLNESSIVLHSGRTIEVSTGEYFRISAPFEISGGTGLMIVVRGYDSIFSLGGPIEEKGRLQYIDGCTDTLIIAPLRLGEPCLNHLHFPAEVAQTRHTHPSIRAGIVARGEGRCVIPGADDNDVSIPLNVGSIFVIPVEGEHSFFTDNSSMDVVAFHPDSDFGPQDECHPMINRTYIGGTSAALLKRTK